ncbi:MAG: RnfABCDGE type electron transport complex subunit D [Sedimentisphaerales bacterium]|nr:RnfABCDGE type electron transport complex subunit D [Sedimentisphaerales bacterium]
MAKEEKKQAEKKILTVSSSPHLAEHVTSQKIMIEVIIGCLPAVTWSIYIFRHMAVIVLLSCLISALVTEWIFNAVRKKPQTISDGSVIVTALILGLSLPPSIPFWAAIIGTVVAVAVAKMIFGGLGNNIFNPAMVGRAFLMACFGTLMTTWTLPSPLKAKLPDSEIAAVTQPTPLALAKQPIKDAANPDLLRKATPYNLNENVGIMFYGMTSGSLGETSALWWLIGGLFLLLRRTITYHIPLGVLISSGVIAFIAWRVNPDVYVNPLVHYCGGGLMMCAFFIATDPVTCPLTKLGRVIFGLGVGSLIMLIRLIGGYPEGVMYAVLLMNAVNPLLDRWTRTTPMGGHVIVD